MALKHGPSLKDSNNTNVNVTYTQKLNSHHTHQDDGLGGLHPGTRSNVASVVPLYTCYTSLVQLSRALFPKSR